MEITIVDTAETAKVKLDLMNKRMVFIFRYLSLVLVFLSSICLLLGFVSGYTNHSSFNGNHNYSDYHLGTGIGIGCLITAAYLELYIFKLRKKMQKFKYSITTYIFSNEGIKTSSDSSETVINWNAVQEIVVQKKGLLIATNNYTCPTMFFLNDQFSLEQIAWIKQKSTKK